MFYTEEQARTILKQVGSAVYYLHSHGVVHRYAINILIANVLYYGQKKKIHLRR